MSHAMVEVVAFPYAQFQASVITGKAEVEWPPYNLDLYSLIIPSSPTSWFYTYMNRWPSMSWKKLLKTLSTWFQSRRSETQRAIYTKKHTKNAKPANKSFLWYLKKLSWILFQVLASFFFYESCFSSYALILGVSRKKSYCIAFSSIIGIKLITFSILS